jgi:hypothetical protein
VPVRICLEEGQITSGQWRSPCFPLSRVGVGALIDSRINGGTSGQVRGIAAQGAAKSRKDRLDSPFGQGTGGPVTADFQSAPFEKLNGVFVLLCRRARAKRPEISPFSGPRVDFARVKPVLTGLELANHESLTLTCVATHVPGLTGGVAIDVTSIAASSLHPHLARQAGCRSMAMRPADAGLQLAQR